MRPLWKRWPTVLATLFFILNVDFVVLPVLAGQFRAMWQTVREFLEDKFDWFVENARIHANGGQANEQLREAAIALIRGTHRLMMYPMMLVLGGTPGGWDRESGVE